MWSVVALALLPHALSDVSSLLTVSRLSDNRTADVLPSAAWPGGPPVFGSDSTGIAISASSLSNQSDLTAFCILDGRGLIHGGCEVGGSCSCKINALSGAGAGLHTVALYSTGLVNGRVQVRLLGSGPAFVRIARGLQSPSASSVDAALRAITPVGSGRLGMYTEFPTVTAQIYQNASRLFQAGNVTIEDVLRVGGFLNSSIWVHQAASAAPQWAFPPGPVYGQAPALGIYCLYQKRANESVGYMPDCPETQSVWRAHAGLMAAAGIEWVAPDATNYDRDPRYKPPPGGSDLGVLRPMELMADEWAAMREGGEATPQISVFARVSGGPLWRWLLDEFFNNETLQGLGLVFRHGPNGTTGQKVFIAAAQVSFRVGS